MLRGDAHLWRRATATPLGQTTQEVASFETQNKRWISSTASRVQTERLHRRQRLNSLCLRLTYRICASVGEQSACERSRIHNKTICFSLDSDQILIKCGFNYWETQNFVKVLLCLSPAAADSPLGLPDTATSSAASRSPVSAAAAHQSSLIVPRSHARPLYADDHVGFGATKAAAIRKTALNAAKLESCTRWILYGQAYPKILCGLASSSSGGIPAGCTQYCPPQSSDNFYVFTYNPVEWRHR